MELHTIGIDLGKKVFHLVGLNQRGEVVGAKEVLTQTTVAAGTGRSPLCFLSFIHTKLESQ
jgi:hypothetical protein